MGVDQDGAVGGAGGASGGAGGASGDVDEARPRWLFPVMVAATGVIAGLVGRFFVWLLHVIQHAVWGGASGGVSTSGSFGAAVEATDPWLRAAIVAGAGVFAGVAWFLLFRYRDGQGIVSIKHAVDGWQMPVVPTFLHATTQVVIVGLGASIGREVAPRELSASITATVADKLRLPAEDRRILVGCAAGAGLAAVYSLPISGAVMALEIFLVTVRPRAVAPALAISALAVLVSHGFTRTEAFYAVPDLVPTASLTVWAVVAAPLIGTLGHWFGRAVHAVDTRRPTNWHLLIALPVTFAAVGALSMAFPQVLGNGQIAAQSAFDAAWFLPLAGIAVAKLVATLATIRAGAWGGTLTPGVAMGAAVGALTGIAWSLVWPGTQIAAFAFLGAAAFLGCSMKAPWTGLCLVLEFTHQGATILVPAVLACGIAQAVDLWWRRRAETPIPARHPD